MKYLRKIAYSCLSVYSLCLWILLLFILKSCNRFIRRAQIVTSPTCTFVHSFMHFIYPDPERLFNHLKTRFITLQWQYCSEHLKVEWSTMALSFCCHLLWINCLQLINFPFPFSFILPRNIHYGYNVFTTPSQWRKVQKVFEPCALLCFLPYNSIIFRIFPDFFLLRWK